MNDTMQPADPASEYQKDTPHPAFQRAKLPLQMKIIVPYLVLSLILAVGVSLLVNRIVFDTADERFKNQLIETAKVTSEITVEQEAQLLETLRLITNVQGVSEALANGDAEQLRTLTFGVVVNARIEAVEFIQISGQHTLAMHHIDGGNTEEYSFSQNGDSSIAGWDFVQKTMNMTRDQQGDKYSGVVDASWGNYFYIAAPVYNAGNQMVGVVLAGQSLAKIVQEIRQLTLAQVSFYSSAGDLLQSSLITPKILPADTAAYVLEVQDQGSLSRELGRRSLISANVDYEEILKPWEVRNGQDLGIVGLALPKTLFVRASTITRLQIFVVLLITLFLVVFVGNRLATSISRPVLRLVRASTQVAEGDLKVKIPITSNDELSILANSFNQMVDSVYQSRHNLVEAYDSTLEGWSKALELRDEETEGHTERVTQLVVQLAQEMEIAGEDLENIRRGAILHDIGKMAISDSILRKPGTLDPQERQIIEMHPQFAYEMLSEINYLRPALKIPYSHHERWDGTGYPQGLRGKQIPIEARIFAVVDVWDAMTSDRVYRKAIANQDVLQYIQEQSGHQFDPEVVTIFLRLLEDEQDILNHA